MHRSLKKGRLHACVLSRVGAKRIWPLTHFDANALIFVYQVEDPNSKLNKFVIINWSPDGAPGPRKAAAVRHAGDVKKLLGASHVTINARHEDDVEEDAVLKLVEKSSGAKYSNQEGAGDARFANTPAERVGGTYQNQ